MHSTNTHIASNQNLSGKSKVFVLIAFKGTHKKFIKQFHKLLNDKKYNKIDINDRLFYRATRISDTNIVESNIIFFNEPDKVKTIHNLLETYFKDNYTLL
ncbi:hypothetical protein [Sulfurimonas sp.]|uniref:hypothetical protein n=1 Tax=Sulfurimonas sp. TaxID=2022749 RepID=UPI002B47FE4E|nr:hypothetical protein [Sulfurimonas sp.]